MLNAHYGIGLAPGADARGLAAAAQGCVTQLSAERLGVAYGGGLLKLSLRAASQLLVPGPELVAESDDHRLCAAGLGPDAVAVLAAARNAVFTRRTARARGRRG